MPIFINTNTMQHNTNINKIFTSVFTGKLSSKNTAKIFFISYAKKVNGFIW